jgi:hypothetical protein
MYALYMYFISIIYVLYMLYPKTSIKPKLNGH